MDNTQYRSDCDLYLIKYWNTTGLHAGKIYIAAENFDKALEIFRTFMGPAFTIDSVKYIDKTIVTQIGE